MRASPVPLFCVAVAIALGTSACVRHIRPHETKTREYKLDQYAELRDHREQGSLWNETADTLFTYRRAARVGDLITVVIDESAAASRDANTDLSRSTSIQFGVSALGGLMKALQEAHPELEPSQLFSALSKSEFSGKGTTARSGAVSATLTARIKRVLPNGDFYLEGSKVVLINDEESHLYVSGVVRPADVEADNVVASSKVADAQVEYTGRGPLAEQQRRGWLTRFWDWINPL
jgi:flagellar L-ring protein precursor FlgH